MLSNGYINCEFDSGNRLISAGGHIYTYNAEDVRIRNLCSDADTTYTYNTNCKLSQLLQKTTNGVTTKYVYGLGLIGEEKCGEFKTYHFDYRGSTVAITDINSNINDTFKYDTYGKMTEHIGSSFVIFGYNGRDGVITDRNGLLYMRARYYSPEMRRFVNADIIPGEISNAVTLNRYAYANGNPVSNTDPFGLSVDGRGGSILSTNFETQNSTEQNIVNQAFVFVSYEHPEGLWVVGHVFIYFVDINGNVSMTEFAGPSKSDATIRWYDNKRNDLIRHLKSSSNPYDYSINKQPKENSSQQGLYYCSNINQITSWNINPTLPIPYFPIDDIAENFRTRGTDHIMLTGDFSKCVDLAKSYYSKQNFPEYDFFFNNCLSYVEALLNMAVVDGENTRKFLKNDHSYIIPRNYLRDLKEVVEKDRQQEYLDSLPKYSI